MNVLGIVYNSPSSWEDANWDIYLPIKGSDNYFKINNDSAYKLPITKEYVEEHYERHLNKYKAICVSENSLTDCIGEMKLQVYIKKKGIKL